MSKEIIIKIHNEVDMNIIGLHGSHLEYFFNKYSLFSKGYFFNPRYKLGRWDGKIAHFSKAGKTYLFLLEEILPQLVKFGYKIKVEDNRDVYVATPDLIHENIFADCIHPDNGKPLILRDYQVDAINSLITVGNGICLAGTGAGKEQPLDAKVLTTVGWVNMGDITLDHYVITPDNTSAKVVGIYPQGKKDIYEISFHDGAKTKCGLNHLWETRFPKQSHKDWTETRVVSTEEIITFLDRKKSGVHTPGNVSIPLCKPLDFFDNNSNIPKIPPYLLGALLGDGHIGEHAVILTSADEFIIEKSKQLASQLDVNLVKIDSSKYDYKFKKNQPRLPNNLLTELNNLKIIGCRSWEKFIPEFYKWMGVDDRLELLRGLMDTDGTVCKRGYCSYTTTSSALASDVQYLAQSLGCTCTISSRTPTFTLNGIKKLGRLAYTCFIRCSTPSMLFSLPRKVERCATNHGDGRIELTRRIKKITYVGHELAQCILIDDPKHLYITDDFIVTHNSYSCAGLLYAYTPHIKKSVTIVPDQNLIMQTKAAYDICKLDTGEYSGKRKELDHQHIVSTWQALQHNPDIMRLFDLIIIDECHKTSGAILRSLICEYAEKVPNRFGFTGTLPKEPIDELAVKYSIGPVRYEIPAHELIDRGVLAKLDISILQLEENLIEEYNQYVIDCGSNKPVSYSKFKDQYFPEYAAETSYLQHNDDRIMWIADKLISERDRVGNVLCLVSSIPIARKLAKNIPNAICVNGQDVKDPKKRQEVYDMFAVRDDLIVIATVHIAGTGLSINRIFSLFSVDVGKSFTRVIQSIGRGLRKASDKHSITFIDVCSDLKCGKKHLKERIQYYEESKYPYKVTKIKYN